jgi:uncharacterized protein with HEPN domain
MLRFAILKWGEASKRVSVAMRERYPDVPWNLFARLRDVLIHQYMKVDVTAIWDDLTVHLPPVIRALDRILSEADPIRDR